MKGIDISEFNGIINFDKLKDDVDFVMVRAGFGARTKLNKPAKEDKLFKKNCKELIRVGIPFGVYYYSYALNEQESKDEISFILSIIKEFKEFITFPVAIDMEDSDSYKKNSGFPDNKTLCNICSTACDIIGNSGYYPIIYANLDYFTHYLKEDSISKFNKWLAWWSKEAIDKVDKSKYQMLQYSSIGQVSGVGNNVDLNESFIEFNKLILYINNIKKMQEIKLYTGIEDITIQYMSLYKFGNFLLDKIHKRVTLGSKIEKSDEDIKTIIQREYDLEDKTMEWLSLYLYSEPLFLKLYRAICEDKNIDN